MPACLPACLQLEADRISLRLIQKLLGADKQARALEAASTLHNMPALEGALKLANHHRWAGAAGWAAGWLAAACVPLGGSQGDSWVAAGCWLHAEVRHLGSLHPTKYTVCLPACLPNHHMFCNPSHPACRATALAERISAFIEQRLALEAAAVELEEEEQYQQYDDGVAPHGGQRQVRGQGRVVGGVRMRPCLDLAVPASPSYASAPPSSA